MVPALKNGNGLAAVYGHAVGPGHHLVRNGHEDLQALGALARGVSRAGGGRHPAYACGARFGDEGVSEALRKMDLTGLLFFAGVLLAVRALTTAGRRRVHRPHVGFIV